MNRPYPEPLSQMPKELTNSLKKFGAVKEKFVEILEYEISNCRRSHQML